MDKSLYLSILFAVLLGSNLVHAQGTMLPTESNLGATNQGALDNYNGGQQMLDRSKHDCMEAHHHPQADGAPDHGLMQRSISEGRQGFAMNNQAQEFARAALQTLQSEAQQRNQVATTDSVASQVDVQQLQQIAAGQSALAGEVQQMLAADGYSIGSDQTSLSAQQSAGTPTNVAGGVAATPTTSTTSNVTRNVSSVNNNTQNLPQAQSDMAGVRVASASPNAATAGLPASNDPKALANAADHLSTAGARTAAEVAADHSKADAERLLLERNRAAVLQQMGGTFGGSQAEEQPSPVHAKSEDIFQAVHNHYESLRGGGTFFEASLPDVSPKTRNSLPEFSKGF